MTYLNKTGCLRPTPTDRLSILLGIQPAELCRLGATLSLDLRGFLDPDHILYGLLSGSSDTRQVRLRSRRPFVPAGWNLLVNLTGLSIRVFKWTYHKWITKYCENVSRFHVLCPGPVPGPLGRACPEQLGLSSIACKLVLGDSIRPCTNGVSLLHRIANRRPCSNSVPYTLGTT